MDIVKSYALALLLAFLVESGVEFLLGRPVDKIPKLTPYKWLLSYVALAAAIGLCFYYSLDAITLITKEAVTPVGMILTGSIVGRGAEAVHGLFMQYILKKPV